MRDAGGAGTAGTASLQVAASSIGSAALPAGMGIAIGAIDAGALAPMLLALALAMCGLYALLSNLTGPRPPRP